MEITFSLDEINEVAQQIIAQNPNKVILFHGEMGVGKTTLIKALAKTLGVIGATSSPTFSLVNEYQTTDNQNRGGMQIDQRGSQRKQRPSSGKILSFYF